MANEVIGRVKCAWCGSPKASVSVSKAGLCCVTCRACHAQTFARAAYSDSMIRQAMTPVERAPTMPEPAPGMEIAPKGEAPKIKAQKVEQGGEAQDVSQGEKKSSGWGLW